MNTEILTVIIKNKKIIQHLIDNSSRLEVSIDNFVSVQLDRIIEEEKVREMKNILFNKRSKTELNKNNDQNVDPLMEKIRESRGE
jgi:hypothetical protein